MASPPLFPPHLLSLQDQATLLLKPVEAQCLLSFEARPEVMLDQNQGREVLLQAVEGYVLQRSVDGKQLVSAFACHYENQFQMIRKIPSMGNGLAEAQGIRFTLKEKPSEAITLLCKQEQRKDLQKLGRVLGRKFIVQVGFHAAFKAIKKIGKGMTACVYDAINFATGKQVAIKSFKRSAYFAQDGGNGRLSFMQEFKILTELNHKNISQIHSVYQTQNSTYIILELYPLSLYGYLQKFGFPSLQQAKSIMTNLLEGVAYLHGKGIMHRDLKLQNIMVKREQGRSGRVIPVIVDLGLAEYITSTKYLYTRCGTPGYVAPEVLKLKSTDPLQTYSCLCDIFSLGVIFHILLFKKPLFEGKQPRQVIKKNSECLIDFNNDDFGSLDEAGRDLLMRMLCRQPLQRITAAEALNHAFLVDQRKKLDLAAEHMFGTSYSIQP